MIRLRVATSQNNGHPIRGIQGREQHGCGSVRGDIIALCVRHPTSLQSHHLMMVVAAQLLELLEAELGARLKFVDTPARIEGGIETFTYGFRVSSLADASGPFSLPMILRLFRERADGIRGRE